MYLRRWISKLAVASGAIGFAAFGMASSSEGAITLNLALGASPTQVATNTNPGNPTQGGTSTFINAGTYTSGTNSVQVNILGSTEKLNGSNGAQADSTTISLVNNSTTNALVITITVHADSYNQPVGPVLITDSFTSSNLTVGSSATFNATVQGNSTLATQTLIGAGQSTVNAPVVTQNGSVSAPYYIDQTITLTLAAGGVANFNATTTLASVVPEPSTMALAIAGLPALGMFWLRRRRALS